MSEATEIHGAELRTNHVGFLMPELSVLFGCSETSKDGSTRLFSAWQDLVGHGLGIQSSPRLGFESGCGIILV